MQRALEVATGQHQRARAGLAQAHRLGLALRKGSGTEFGYALFRRGFDVEIDATGARVGGRAIGRERARGAPE